MPKYRVWVRSVPGMYEQYDGYVDVYAPHSSFAFDAAVEQLRRGSFPDRNRGMWRLDPEKEIQRLDGGTDPEEPPEPDPEAA